VGVDGPNVGGVGAIGEAGAMLELAGE